MTITFTEELVRRLEPIMSHLRDFYTPAEAVVWLISPHSMLGNRAAIDLIREGDTAPLFRVIQMMEGQVAT